MSRPAEGEVQEGRGYRRLNAGAVRLHNDHLQSGFRKAVRCLVCTQGLGGALTEVKEERSVGKPASVAEGDGTNEEGDPTSSSGDGDDPGGQADQMLAW